ncbi:Cell death specification protein 2 [Amphibalanus amphitrite]|uniref:Cell death specification protein 2 n=1 Tax=Amphibalanus amphitrite TaxID=1232801 RepID=A0A6A4X411_AMPAM|nr:Cell death specification protein 2 [Amphibalanus amphitrite]
MKVLFVLFALVAAASASDLGQYGDEQEHQDVEHTPYEFSYAVEDDDTVFSQSEQGDEEGDVEGEYAVNLPDGRVQTKLLGMTAHDEFRNHRDTCPEMRLPVLGESRRQKNNEAAKRSRDARRAKEDGVAVRCALLEAENVQLRLEMAWLKNETARLKYVLYST